ncbi:organomercurial lyase, partial [Clostridioides difficile]
MSQIEKYNSLDNTQQKIRISIMDMIIDKGSSVTLQEVTE